MGGVVSTRRLATCAVGAAPGPVAHPVSNTIMAVVISLISMFLSSGRDAARGQDVRRSEILGPYDFAQAMKDTQGRPDVSVLPIASVLRARKTDLSIAHVRCGNRRMAAKPEDLVDLP